jgi:hypothetical protein
VKGGNDNEVRREGGKDQEKIKINMTW